MFLILAVLLFSTGYTAQTKYDHCKSIEFKGEFCSLQKKMSKYEEKK